MKENIAIGISIIALAVALVSGSAGGSGLGGDTNFDSLDVTDGYKVDSTTIIDGSGAITLPAGQNLTVTTSNTATSSIEVGCIDTYATSTDTAIRLSATTTPGVAYWTYGTCAGL